ncbi:MAG: DUF503 domain-containing protein [Acidimicrobiales bacterium]|nr:DUF503 domain-containing protein [Acidimicrobiales bacterium]
MTVHVLALTVELRVPGAQSLKDKRAVVKTVLDGARRRYQVAAAETGHHDKWQRAEVGFAAVSGSYRHLEQVVDEIERFVWSFPEIEVIGSERRWVETS